MQTITQRAEAIADMGLVLITEMDTKGRVVAATVPAKNSDRAVVRFSRSGNKIIVMSCTHLRVDGTQHECEGHKYGHVCYHARAALIASAKRLKKKITFGNGEIIVTVFGNEANATRVA